MQFVIKGTPDEIQTQLMEMVECFDCFDTGEVRDGQHDDIIIRKCHCQ